MTLLRQEDINLSMSVESHVMAFDAEKSRHTGKKVKVKV